MSSERRIEKLSVLIKEILSEMIDSELEFPPSTLVTLTKVRISPDKHYAAVFFSILGGDVKTAVETLQKNVYHIQQLLNKKMRTRPVPKISFAVDEGEFKREKIERTLVKLKRKQEL